MTRPWCPHEARGVVLKPLAGPMSNVARSSFQAASRELIASSSRSALRNDADAVTAAIARLKQDLRSGESDEGPTAA